MKFISKPVASCAARLGILSELERLPHLSFETPLLMLYTKRGTVPHITKDVLQRITKNHELLTVSMSTTIGMAEPVKYLNSISEFIGLKEYPVFLTIQDSSEKSMTGYNATDTIALWTKNGKRIMNPDQYMDIVEAFRPDLYLAMCDGDTDIDSKPKRLVKSVHRSKTMLEKCLVRHSESPVLRNKGIIAAIEGGYDLNSRTFAIKNLEGKNVAGYVIDGLHVNGPDVEHISFQQIENVVKHTINLLPGDKMRISMGGWNPVVVMNLVELGIDFFDSSYPYFITERSCALTFLYENTANNDPAVMSMASSRHVEAFIPICESCQCLTCKNHTRAYLNHLHHTKELLGLVLLMIHNTHHYQEFFKEIRTSLKNGTFNELKARICQKFDDNIPN